MHEYMSFSIFNGYLWDPIKITTHWLSKMSNLNVHLMSEPIKSANMSLLSGPPQHEMAAHYYHHLSKQQPYFNACQKISKKNACQKKNDNKK